MKVTFFSPHSGNACDGAPIAPPTKIVEVARALDGLTLDIDDAKALIEKAHASISALDAKVRIESDCIVLIATIQLARSYSSTSWRVIRFRPAT